MNQIELNSVNAKIQILKEEKSSTLDLILKNDDFKFGPEEAVEMKIPRE